MAHICLLHSDCICAHQHRPSVVRPLCLFLKFGLEKASIDVLKGGGEGDHFAKPGTEGKLRPEEKKIKMNFSKWIPIVSEWAVLMIEMFSLGHFCS